MTRPTKERYSCGKCLLSVTVASVGNCTDAGQDLVHAVAKLTAERDEARNATKRMRYASWEDDDEWCVALGETDALLTKWSAEDAAKPPASSRRG